MATLLRWFCVLSIVACGIYVPEQASAQHEHMAEMSANQQFEREMMESMKRMDKDMMSAPMTGDPDHDFATMMIPHHQGAIDMAKVELIYGKDPVLRRLAQEIIVTQEQEIEVMRLRLKQFKTK